MIVIGLIGGIASGKSFVAKCFANLGAEILDADSIGHAVLDLPEIISEVQQMWPKVKLVDGRIDRKSLAHIVFRDTDHQLHLLQLERITHPLIGQRIDQRLTELKQQSAIATVLDAPVLIKAGWQRKCDKIVFVEASQAIRSERALARGWSADELAQRELSQTSLAEKRKWATDLVDNSGSQQSTQSQVNSIWNDWGFANLPCPAASTL